MGYTFFVYGLVVQFVYADPGLYSPGEVIQKSILSKESIEALLRQNLIEDGLDLSGVRLELDSALPLIKDFFPKEYKFRSAGREIRPGKRIFPLERIINGKKIESHLVSFVIETKKKVFFPNHIIEKGTVIRENDFRVVEKWDRESGNDYLETSPVGKTALSNLSTDKVIAKKQVRLLHEIERGQEVTLYVATTNLFVKAKGRALASGNSGEIIKVMNITSNKMLQARIQSPGLCEVL